MELDKVGSELVCLFVEKLLSFKKKVFGRGPKGPQKNRPVMPLLQNELAAKSVNPVLTG